MEILRISLIDSKISSQKFSFYENFFELKKTEYIMKMGEYHCENHLEIYGKWEDLKAFTINNWGNQGLSFRKLTDVEQPCMIEYEKEIFNREMDMIYYTFLTRQEPPEKWLSQISKQYSHLEFNLYYQNRKIDKTGDYMIKNGEIYYKEELAN
jgi:hypothetical protein